MLTGALIGVSISFIFTIIISLIFGDGNYYPVMPELIDSCGNEINAVILQTLCSMLYGGIWAGGTVIWEQEQWSLLRQTLLHLVICSAATFPIAYCMHWMSHSAAGIFFYIGVFIIIYFAIWLLQYWSIKRRIRQINLHMQQNK